MEGGGRREGGDGPPAACDRSWSMEGSGKWKEVMRAGGTTGSLGSTRGSFPRG